MKLTEHEKEILRDGLILQQQKVIEDRRQRAQNTFRKWTNLDEQIAITLDSKRDNIQQMLKKLDASSGSFDW
ncbi:cyclopropane fatty-acyl-phospholipid synthase-like methyltransferase [Oxalobacteraceae bacterium GrIS 2.11]